ncbi:putative basic amino acid antiporter YfcC [Alteromonas facilis]|uniref:putative basic amino acid antiporter YfcC n=1 Tax=Alteromonas facilis TaxID=2048004 RepID=UPI000C28B48D|nr:putative basic amino acid antiporter YfcC [Alteromonas facilis]
MTTIPKDSLSSRIPDAFVILFFVIILAFVLTYFIPQGIYDTRDVLVNGQSRTLVDANSFRLISEDAQGVSLFSSNADHTGMLNYAFDGLVSGNKWGSAVGVVAFILIVGGSFGIIMRSQAIHNGVMALISKTQNAGRLILPLMFVLFSLGGAIFGMGEEAIAFCIVLVPLIIALGYDAITAVLITYVATQVGFATSWMNPFSVAIAQGIAGVPLLSGQGFRMIMWAVFTSVTLIFTLIYAQRIHRNPEQSLSFNSDQHFRQQQQTTQSDYTPVDSIILLIFAAGIGWVIWGVTVHEFYIPQIASQFFTIGIAVGIIATLSGRLRVNEVSQAFVDGAKDLLPAALIVGMAKGIVLVLGGDDVTQPSVLNTILFHTSEAINEVGQLGSALLMLVFQSGFNFFVASGSGQAAITMPLMSPLSDLVGVSRQVAVLAFQLGDGLTNLIIPTSASLIGCLGVARLDWSIWFRFVWRLTLMLFMLACITITIAVLIGFQ